MPMRLSVNVSLPLIARTLNQRYQEMLYEGTIRDWTGGDSEVKVFKKGPILLTGKEKYVKAEIPVSIRVKLRRNDPGLINAIKSIAGISRLEAEIRAGFRIHLSLNSDWSLSCTVDPEFEWLRKPTIGSLLPVRITSWIEPAIKRSLDQQADQIREEIITQLGVPDSLQAPWEALFMPIQLHESLPLYAIGKSHKREAPSSVIHCHPEELAIDIGIPIEGKLSMEPLVPHDPPLLPVNVPAGKVDQNEILPVSWMLSPEQLLSLLPGKRKNTEVIMEEGSQSILVTRIGRMQASLRVFPAISEDGKLIAVSRMEWISGRIPRFIKLWLTKTIRTRLNRELEAAISSAMTQLGTELRHLSLGFGWVLTAREVSLSITEGRIHSKGLHIQGDLSGKVGLHLDDL